MFFLSLWKIQNLLSRTAFISEVSFASLDHVCGHLNILLKIHWYYIALGWSGRLADKLKICLIQFIFRLWSALLICAYPHSCLRLGNLPNTLHPVFILSHICIFLENVYHWCLHKVCCIVTMASERISIINYSQYIVIMPFGCLYREIVCKMNGRVCANLSFVWLPKTSRVPAAW